MKMLYFKIDAIENLAYDHKTKLPCQSFAQIKWDETEEGFEEKARLKVIEDLNIKNQDSVVQIEEPEFPSDEEEIASEIETLSFLIT